VPDRPSRPEAKDGFGLTLEFPVEALAEAVAERVFDTMERKEQSPWLTKREAIEYSRLAKGTFEMHAANGRIPSHGGKTKIFHRGELDHALLRL
jgi:hypothetical protein